MARFDYKKWVTENKYRIQPTMDGSGGMVNEQPQPCDSQWPSTSCHAFSKCISGLSDNSNLVITLGGGMSNPMFMYNEMCPNGCQQGDTIEDINGVFWIYDGVNPSAILQTAVTSNAGNGITSCVQGYECTAMNSPCTQGCWPIDNTVCYDDINDCDNNCWSVSGCIDPSANNYNTGANADCSGTIGGTDNSCCGYGYNCKIQTSPQDIGLKKAPPTGGERWEDDLETIDEWVGSSICKKAPPGTTGTYPDVASCKAGPCGPVLDTSTDER